MSKSDKSLFEFYGIPWRIFYKIIKKRFKSITNPWKSGIWLESPNPESLFGLSTTAVSEPAVTGFLKAQACKLFSQSLAVFRIFILACLFHGFAVVLGCIAARQMESSMQDKNSSWFDDFVVALGCKAACKKQSEWVNQNWLSEVNYHLRRKHDI